LSVVLAARKGTTNKKTHKANTYAHRVEIEGPSSVIYSPDKPLSCGARVWVETDNTVMIYTGDSIKVVA
jgi:hypothetical protein